MKKSLIIISSSVLMLSIIIIPVVLRPYGPFPDPSKFSSFIERIVPDNSYLPVIYSLEELDAKSIYFAMTADISQIENIAQLIEEEESFLSTYNPKEFNKKDWRRHTFIYSVNLSLGVEKEEFLTLFSIFQTHMFYLNYSTDDYYSVTYFNSSTSDRELWKINETADYIFSSEAPLIFVNQTIVISDIYAPLAGTGTHFTRFILCFPDGQPVFFISNEGPWWIS